jgi:hypothetical protein
MSLTCGFEAANPKGALLQTYDTAQGVQQNCMGHPVYGSMEMEWQI